MWGAVAALRLRQAGKGIRARGCYTRRMQARDLLRQLQRTVDELAVLNEIGKALTSSLDIGEVMHLILAKVSDS